MDYLEIVKQLKRQWAETPEADTGMRCAKSAESVKSPTSAGMVGDGQPPPLDRPPATREELARLIDRLADAQAFAAWLERLMQQDG
jgi:hypothetical protein